jgi:hypothetical protein
MLTDPIDKSRRIAKGIKLVASYDDDLTNLEPIEWMGFSWRYEESDVSSVRTTITPKSTTSTKYAY